MAGPQTTPPPTDSPNQTAVAKQVLRYTVNKTNSQRNPLGRVNRLFSLRGALALGHDFLLVALCWGRPVPVIPGGFVSARGLRFPPRVPRLTEDVGVSSTSTDVAGRAEGCPWRAESKLKSCSDEGAWAESEQDGQNKETKIRSVCAVQPQIAK